MIRKKKESHSHENHERWLVSYADFITLLFAFFVVMYATSNNNEEKQKEFEKSVRANLHLVYEGGTSGQNPKNSLMETIDELRRPIDSFPKSGGPQEVQDYLQRKVDQSASTHLKNSLSGLRHEWYGVRMSLAASSFFSPGSYKLKMSSLKIIDELMSALKDSQNKIIIEGHTDNVPIRNSLIESNWELSSLRASSVARYLIKYHKIDPRRIVAAGYADTRPVVPNNTEENRSKNRRIDFLIVSDDKINKEGF
ncbi:MAG: OmpA family protein [Bdellovibrionales bacterium]|nr:OmpA family protein [Bdellovibrionales bacterium]